MKKMKCALFGLGRIQRPSIILGRGSLAQADLGSESLRSVPAEDPGLQVEADASVVKPFTDEPDRP